MQNTKSNHGFFIQLDSEHEYHEQPYSFDTWADVTFKYINNNKKTVNKLRPIENRKNYARKYN